MTGDTQSVASTLFARTLRSELDLDTALAAIVNAAVEHVPGTPGSRWTRPSFAFLRVETTDVADLKGEDEDGACESSAIAMMCGGPGVGRQERSRGQKLAAKVKARQRRLVQEEAVRERHVRLVMERAGDPRFVQRSVGPDGTRTLQWDRDTPAGRRMAEVVERQHEQFRDKFGREVRDDDPLFFDPDADTPRAMDPDAVDAGFRQIFDAVIEQADEMGIDPALLKASRDLGYMVTTENQHLSSAEEYLS